jgi:hypothetical protein
MTQFSNRHLRSIIDLFAEPLNQHLHDEIETLLSLSKYGDSLDLAGIAEKAAENAIGSLSKTAVIPGILLNHDVTYQGGLHATFPPIPWPVRWVLMHICTLWYWWWWRFASCDTYGRPKVLQTT